MNIIKLTKINKKLIKNNANKVIIKHFTTFQQKVVSGEVESQPKVY